MNAINWGVVFGVCSLLLLQVTFAVGLGFLYYACKLEVQRAKDAFTGHLRETDKLKNVNESLTKKVDKYEDKLEAFRSVKIDGWEDADTELARKIKSNTARISQLHKMLKEGYEDGDPQQDLMAGLAPAPNINIEQPAGGLAQDFGRSVNGVI